mgnify:CR=1 FL=1
MSPEEAVACADAGAKGIVVSNHGGRILDGMVGTADVLPEIAKAVKGRLTIFVDGGVRHGEDVLKMLALGAMPSSSVVPLPSQLSAARRKPLSSSSML